jgi:putative AdoMet-dependent methyltransferase
VTTRKLESWMFREFQPVGVDLNSTSSVDVYDRNQGTDTARDDALLDRLQIRDGSVFVDLGTGTGSLPTQAALRGAEAHAVDVSENMLAYTSRRAEAAGVAVHCHHAGFLTYVPEHRPADAVATRSALHQLPDTWKQVALNRIAAMLAPGGNFYLWDVMWSFPSQDALTSLPAWIDAMAQPEGQGFTRASFETHVREEFSTFDWILAGMIERAGLEILESGCPAPWYGEFLARKPL